MPSDFAFQPVFTLGFHTPASVYPGISHSSQCLPWDFTLQPVYHGILHSSQCLPWNVTLQPVFFIEHWYSSQCILWDFTSVRLRYGLLVLKRMGLDQQEGLEKFILLGYITVPIAHGATIMQPKNLQGINPTLDFTPVVTMWFPFLAAFFFQANG